VTTMFLTTIHLLLSVLNRILLRRRQPLSPNEYSVTPCTTGLLVRQSYL
jgi:hypothetical protein